MRREVESLLAQPSGGDFLDRPAIQNAPELLTDAAFTEIARALCLGPYRIESKLGEGGMGEVFRAIDTRLGRAVALKITHERFNARFEREARAISSLNHPHICTLYDIGPNYLVMELLEGDTIAARLKDGPLPLDQALHYASQIAAALADAHEHGIVHRDLKPANIMLVKSGVKVLDFGLAKWEHAPGLNNELPMIQPMLTEAGVMMGTLAYMSPEQAEGKKVDARTDIFSFGAVLYEMVTGRRAFGGDSMASILSAILRDEPKPATEIVQRSSARARQDRHALPAKGPQPEVSTRGRSEDRLAAGKGRTRRPVIPRSPRRRRPDRACGAGGGSPAVAASVAVSFAVGWWFHSPQADAGLPGS